MSLIFWVRNIDVVSMSAMGILTHLYSPNKNVILIFVIWT